MTKTRRALLITLYGLLSAIALLATYLLATYLPRQDGESLTVTVPSLVGSVYAADDGRLPSEWYDVTFDYRADAQSEAGTVLLQYPPALSERRVIPSRSRCALRLTLSTGAAQFTIPSLVGASAREAEVLLRSHGLIVRTVSRTRSDLSSGQVIASEPAEGTVVREGEVVTLTVSEAKTTRTVRVPDVVGQTLAQANGALALRGLRPREVTYERSSAPAGTVISQRPLSGTLVPTGTEAALTVSEGGASEAEQEMSMEEQE